MPSSCLRPVLRNGAGVAITCRNGSGCVRRFSAVAARQQEIRDAYILSASRTPTAKFNGSFLTVSAPKLGAVAIKSAIEKSGVPVSKITDVYMGNVMQASVGQAPARQAAVFAGLPSSVEAITINKVCASGLKSVVFAAQNIQLGLAEAQVAGGMESMSQVPYYVPRASSLPAFGHVRMEDGLIKDGLTDVYDQIHMGNCAENTAKKYEVSREMQDQYAIQSYERAQAAWAANAFADEIVPVTVKGRKGETVINKDEGYLDVKLEKIPTLKPAFIRDGSGTVTAANSSTLNDGASALVLGSKEMAQQYGFKSRVLARICGSADAAMDPIDFPVAPAKAVPIALERAGITKAQVAIWEFNEAFAAVIKANEKILGLEGAKVNPLGGAISLGHALGSSGSRILTTLLHQLEPGQYGVAAICNGGGAATALVVQRIESVLSAVLAVAPVTAPTPLERLPKPSMALVTQFLTSLRHFVVSLDGDELAAWLRVEPSPTAGSYFQLREELRNGFSGASAVEGLVDKCITEVDDPPEGTGSPWPSFIAFVKDYLLYWKDADFDDLMGLQDMLSGLLTSCATALSHPQYGSIMFQTSIRLSEALSKVVMMLHRRPELMTGRRAATGGEDSKSMVEQSADIIQKIFTSCLTDRSSTRFAKPEGKKVGVYIFANLVLKLLFTCGKSRLAAQLLLNLSTSGPPLQLYPAAQRVTFLYYLGRFNFDCDNFVRASQCLQEAYLQTPPALQQHRKLILTYLIPSNIMLGRFPTRSLLSRPEASALAPVFLLIMAAVRKGDFVAFQQAIAAHERWLYRKGLLFTLMFRLRPLVWRSFIRRVFLLTYEPPATENSRAAPTLNLADIFVAATYAQKRLEGYVPARAQQAPPKPAGANSFFKMAVTNSATADAASTLVPPAGGRPRKLKPSEGLFWGNLGVTMKEVEGVVAALIAQGLMHGFLAHSSGKFAVMGAKKAGGPLLAGWPGVARGVVDRLAEEGLDAEEVPAWVKMPPGFM